MLYSWSKPPMGMGDQSVSAAFQAGYAGSIPVARSAVKALVNRCADRSGAIRNPLVSCVPAACRSPRAGVLGRVPVALAQARADAVRSMVRYQ
jgi:hypothetical protein